MINFCMKRRIQNLLILVIVFSQACAQKTPEIIADRIDFCNSNFEENLLPQLKTEFERLEKHFIENGLLNDNSGRSYYSVYETITKEDGLSFVSDYSSPIIDSIEFNIISKCFYQLLTTDEINELTQRHYEASLKIYQPIEGDVSPRMITQKIIDNLMESDFDLKFYKLSSLLTFYRMTAPKGIDLLINGKGSNKNIELWFSIELGANDQLSVLANKITLDELTTELQNFLGNTTSEKAVEITASKDASYEAYINLLDAVNERFDIIRNQEANNKYGKSLDELTKTELDDIKKSIPRNIRINEPK